MTMEITMRIINPILSIFLLTIFTCARAESDCGSDSLNRDQELSCAHTEEIGKKLLAEHLYKSLRRDVPPIQQTALDKNHATWLNKLETDCALQRDAFNNWGKDSVPDADFQYQGCRTSVVGQQIAFYEGLICPDSMETGEKPDCDKLKLILKQVKK